MDAVVPNGRPPTPSAQNPRDRFSRAVRRWPGFPRWCALLFVGVGWTLAPILRAAGTVATPNILFLLSDDHSVPFVGCYGSRDVRTPNLDRLASQGLRLDRFFTSAPQCVPSRATLMTGRSPVAARMTRFEATLPRDEITFPEILRRDARYFTGVCGRIYHLDGGAPRDTLVASGAIERLGLRTFPERMDFVEIGDQLKVAARFEAFLDRVPRGRPFFFWINYSDPHHPWNADPAFRPDPAKLDIPPFLPDTPAVRGALADHCAEINRLDGLVQQALDVLERRGLAGNTLVVFAGDNGLALPRGKGSLYDPGLNTPLIVRWPGVVRSGGATDALISGEDLAPTLLEVAGLRAPARMSGVSFLKLLRGEPHEPRRFIFGERGMHGSAKLSPGVTSAEVDLARCVRSERYKLIYNFTTWIPFAPVDSARDAYWKDIVERHQAGRLPAQFGAAYFQLPRPIYEFYDLQADPGEFTNLAGRPDYDPAFREHLAALWDKMVLDWDYLPLPDPSPRIGSRGGTGRSTQRGDGGEAHELSDRLARHLTGTFRPAQVP